MDIVAISDTHLMHVRHDLEVPEGDVLVHAGDATFSGKEHEVLLFAHWFRGLPHKYKIFVPGNHDWLFQTHESRARELLGDDIHCLIDQGASIDGVRFWGSPWQPWFLDWAFNLQRGAPLKAKWDLIPEGVDVLITHGPPYGVGDRVQSGEHVGCEELRLAIERVSPRIHIFGHIHGGYGIYESPVTRFVNASICDEAYRPTNAAVVLISRHPIGSLPQAK